MISIKKLIEDCAEVQDKITGFDLITSVIGSEISIDNDIRLHFPAPTGPEMARHVPKNNYPDKITIPFSVFTQILDVLPKTSNLNSVQNIISRGREQFVKGNV